MDKVDRLGWTVGFAREYRGMKLGFRADRTEALEVLRELIEPLQTHESNAEEVDYLYSYRGGRQRGKFRDYHLLYQSARKVVRTLDAAELQAALELEVNLLLGMTAPDTVCLRAGSVLRGGRALLVLGGEGQGTSTLLAALHGAGATRLTDSFVLLDAHSGRMLSHGQPEVGAVFSTGFTPSRRFRPRRLASGEAALCLFGAAPAASVQAERLLPAVARFSRLIPVFKGDRSRVEAAAWLILREFDKLYL